MTGVGYRHENHPAARWNFQRGVEEK